ncbi:MAG TPA: bifunctional glycosyltransferase family 2 protein/CDP-glycerol:glycerophosphate glycerophosphotransferase [Streptosporangiaceae bacterium]|nr:bifunctional glycosyltransferase family 2 protein/CDP-glycerol:glycerophosphate glycerophosphotransferase [Streptosporangiaceae bacterium]
MTERLVSVVVPFYNNADHLGQCLASIAAQSHAALEVIMVDDGSTDGSVDIARAQAAADPRFRLVGVTNGGPGWARNHGVAAATGEFLAFVDADDVLPPDAYATMLAVLAASGSDFVSGGVLRLSAAGLGKSGLHDRAIKAKKLRTHISRSPELFYDISVWNKLFRRSFWDASALTIPEGMVWEDLVAMTQAHVLATSVDVITDPIYHWRDRDKGELSITQSRTRIGNLRDRIAALRMIDDFLRARARPAMVAEHQRKALVNDLWLYVRDLHLASAAYQTEFADLVGGYLRQVSPRVLRGLPATHKLAYYLIARGREAELVTLARWLAEHPGRTPPMVRVRGRRYADLPFRQDRALAIPARVYRPQWRDLDPHVRVDEISWRGDRLVIAGSAYVPSVDVGSRRHAGKLLVLLARGGRRPPVVLRARSVLRSDVTQASGQDRYSYDWSGFRGEIPGRVLRAGRRWLAGDWDCYLLVRGRATWRPVRLHTPGPDAERPAPREIAPGLSLGAVWAGGRLVLRLRPQKPSAEPGVSVRPAMCVRQSWGPDGALMLRGAAVAGDCRVVLSHLDGWGCYELPVPADGGAGEGFSAAVSVGAMEAFGERRPLRDGRWAVGLRGPDGEPVSGAWAIETRPVTVGPKVYRCGVLRGPDHAGPGEARPDEAGPGQAGPGHAGPGQAGSGLILTVGPKLGPAERGRIRRRLLRDIYYRAQRLMPVRAGTILFSSFHGKLCGDNPRAIADELRRRGDSREHIWAVSDWSVPGPPGARTVLTGTTAYFAALARSRYLVVNDHVPLPYRKRRGQRHVQTWHGTPLKRLGYDIGVPKMASGRRYLEYMAGDVAQWDLLLSPNPFSTPIMRRAFGYDGEVSETGYPRDDALVTAGPAVAAAADEIRRRIGLPDGRRVALYVPTWRDNAHDAAGRYLLDFRLDLAAAAERLAGQYALAIRGHHLMTGGMPAGSPPGFAFDVTGYPDINDLLLVADVLITDYSSVMFDFAPTGKPMLFFTYDLEQYRDQIRGFYFDFEADAPGPLLATSGEVVDALADLDAVTARYEAPRAAFIARFCPLDDGKASGRACDRIFGT